MVRGNSPPEGETCAILVDDRRDASGGVDTSGTYHSARDCDSYDNYPPEGEDRALDTCSPSQLHARLSGSVSYDIMPNGEALD